MDGSIQSLKVFVNPFEFTRAAIGGSVGGNMRRREFLTVSTKLGMMALLGALGVGCQGKSQPVIGLADLPYPLDALEPYLSSKTLSFHYYKHQKNYVDTVNRLIRGTAHRSKPLLDIIRSASGDPAAEMIFNHAAQVFNHEFYWKSMKPGGGGPPTGSMEAHISDSFGSYRRFYKEFSNLASAQFGSGWVWLIQADQTLRVIATSNADTPVADGKLPLLCIDLWEHAYYLDYQNRRDDYVKAFLDHLVNWEFAETNARQT